MTTAIVKDRPGYTNVTRRYEHKDHGLIGAIFLQIPTGDWYLDGEKLPAESVEYLVHFAGQTLQDAYAKSENLEEAKKKFNEKYLRILNGYSGQRGSGGVSELRRQMRIVATKAMKKAGLDTSKVAMIDDWIDGNDDRKAKVEARAQQRIDALAAIELDDIA